MTRAQLRFGHGEHNREGWLQKERDMEAGSENWNRLARIVLTDLFHETGLYDELSRGQRKKLDRRNQIAIDPETPRTYRERRAANQAYANGSFPLWSIPVILGASFVGAGAESLESYSKTGKPGSTWLGKRFQALDRRLTLDEEIRSVDAIHEGIISRLGPEVRIGTAALEASGEPTDYVINIRELLEAAEATFEQDGTTANLVAKRRASPLFTEEAPRPLSMQDQRVRAAQVFMASGLLREGALCQIDLERRADLLPDGDNTFRIHTSAPYAYLYEDTDLTDAYQPSTWLYSDRVLDPSPLTELLQRSVS